MVDLLADGQWHSFDDLIRAGAKHVPPSRAQQWYRMNLGNRHTGVSPWRVKAVDVHDQLRDGRRDGLRRTIERMHQKGKIEIRNPSGGKSIAGKEARLIPR